ncbi:TetR/AcrR family transcriptional regulator [Aliamphritea spongicola]|nr:TetR/AcrR family transcriptional regulator [Aliamphritea spongicola]
MTEKQQLIIRTALKLFYRQGIHAVGINEIIQQSGVAKKTLYNYFSGKEALILAALHYRDEIFMGWLGGIMSAAKPGQPALIAMFHGLDDWFNDHAEALGISGGFSSMPVANTLIRKPRYIRPVKRTKHTFTHWLCNIRSWSARTGLQLNS